MRRQLKRWLEVTALFISLFNAQSVAGITQNQDKKTENYLDLTLLSSNKQVVGDVIGKHFDKSNWEAKKSYDASAMNHLNQTKVFPKEKIAEVTASK